MDREQLFWIRVWSIVGVGVTLTAAILAISVCYHTKLFVEKGYTKTTLPGTAGAQWVLPNDNK